MFNFFKKRNDDKIIDEAMTIIGKAFVLQGYSSEEAVEVAQYSLNEVITDDSSNLPKPWVLAVFSMFSLKQSLKSQNNSEFSKLLLDLEEVIDLALSNAYEQATGDDVVILDGISKENK